MLCRGCGNELIAFEYCPECDEAIHWKCTSCERENEKSVHTHTTNMQKVQDLSKKASVAGAAAVATLVSGLSSIILIA